LTTDKHLILQEEKRGSKATQNLVEITPLEVLSRE
jgi:hypothetical protein